MTLDRRGFAKSLSGVVGGVLAGLPHARVRAGTGGRSRGAHERRDSRQRR